MRIGIADALRNPIKQDGRDARMPRGRRPAQRIIAVGSGMLLACPRAPARRTGAYFLGNFN